MTVTSATFSRWRSTRLRTAGCEDYEALLPVSLRSFQGYRLLQEYFAFILGSP